MSSIYARQPAPSASAAFQRVALASAAFAAALGLWQWLRPYALYQLACVNLGNYPVGDALADHAVRARFPDWPDPRPAPGEPAYFGWRTNTSHTGRRATAFAQTRVLRHPYSSDRAAVWNEWRILDNRLDLLALLRGISLGLIPSGDDRDADGTLELVHCSTDFARQFHRSRRAPSVEYVRFSIVTLGQERHSLIAVVDLPLRNSDPWPEPYWTNADGDNLHELEWLQWTPPTPTATAPATPLRATYVSILKLRWLRPGVMTCDAPPPGVCIWFAKEKDKATFSPEESIDDVARRLLGEPPGPPTDAPEPWGNPVGR